MKINIKQQQFDGIWSWIFHSPAETIRVGGYKKEDRTKFIPDLFFLDRVDEFQIQTRRIY